MSTIGNIIWIIFGGFLVFIIYLFGSLILMITIIGIPFGFQTLKIAMLALMPFGKEVQPGKRFSGCIYIIINVLWILIAGIELAIIHITFAALFAITIIGIPFALQHLKLAQLALLPFGQNVITVED